VPPSKPVKAIAPWSAWSKTVGKSSWVTAAVRIWPTAVTLADFFLGPVAFLAGPQRADAIGQVVGQFGQQLRLFRVESVRLGGVNVQRAEHAALDRQRQANASSVASLAGFVAPGQEARILQDVLHGARLARAEGGADRAAPALRVGPGDVHRLQVAFFKAVLRDGPDGLGLVVFREANPSQPIAAVVHHDTANLIQQFRFVRGSNQRLVALADGFERAIGLCQTQIGLTGRPPSMRPSRI
jgi:hypothetical protein